MNCLAPAYKLQCGSWCTNEQGDVTIEQVKGTRAMAWCWRWLYRTSMELLLRCSWCSCPLVLVWPGAWYGATAATKPTSGLRHAQAQPWSTSLPTFHSETQRYRSGQRDTWSRLCRARCTRVGCTEDIHPVRQAVSVAYKPAMAVLLWEKNTVPRLISRADKSSRTRWLTWMAKPCHVHCHSISHST
jgi:hypothetical protein